MPKPGQIGIRMQSTVRFEARGNVDVQTQTQAGGTVVVQPPPPPPPAPIVAIQNAPVVEFFGIPLEGVQDVVFVLDCSGSMAAGVPHRLTTYQVPADPPAPPPPPDAFTPPPPAGPPPGEGPPPPAEPAPPTTTEPTPPAPVAPPPDPNAPPAMVTKTRQLSKIEVAIAELSDALSRLPAGTRMNILFFNNDLDAYAPSLVPLEDAARAGLIEFVRASTPRGGTALAPALRLSYMLNAKRVVLLSDGLGNIGGDGEAVLRDGREAMRGGIRIDAVGVGLDQDGAMLETLAKESGGLYQPL